MTQCLSLCLSLSLCDLWYYVAMNSESQNALQVYFYVMFLKYMVCVPFVHWLSDTETKIQKLISRPAF